MTSNNKLNKSDIKNSTYHYFDDIININDFGYKTIGHIGYKTPNGVKALCIIFNKINGYTESNNESKYLTYIPINKNKNMLIKYK